jgi:hypothetical protein
MEILLAILFICVIIAVSRMWVGSAAESSSEETDYSSL